MSAVVPTNYATDWLYGMCNRDRWRQVRACCDPASFVDEFLPTAPHTFLVFLSSALWFDAVLLVIRFQLP